MPKKKKPVKDKIRRTQVTLYRLDDLDLTPEMQLRPEYQSEGALEYSMETLTYEDLIARALQSPIALQRFFGIRPGALPKDKSQIDTDSDDTSRTYILADKLLYPTAFEILLKRDFGIAYKHQECSAKTESDRKMVADSLRLYAPSPNNTNGVSRLENLTKLRELYVWVASSGNPNKMYDRAGSNAEVTFQGDGMCDYRDRSYAPRERTSVVTFFLMLHGRLDISDLLQRSYTFSVLAINDIENVVPLPLLYTVSHGRSIIRFEDEEYKYFREYLRSYMEFRRPLGIFRLGDGEAKATTMAVLNRNLTDKVEYGTESITPEYLLFRSSRGKQIYCVSISFSSNSFLIDAGDSFENSDIVILKYIDENQNISPRAICLFISEGETIESTMVFVVIDLPIGGIPQVRQYKSYQPFRPSNWKLINEAQSNFVTWAASGSKTRFYFDPSSGKTAEYVDHEVVLPGHDENGFTNNVTLTSPAIAFNFASPKGVLKAVYGSKQTDLLPVRDLSVVRSGLVIVDIGVGEPLAED